MSSEIDTVFNALLYGSGRWFGLVFLVGSILILCKYVKKAGIVFFPILLFLSISYLQNIEGDSSFMWSALITLIAMLIVIYGLIDEYKH